MLAVGITALSISQTKFEGGILILSVCLFKLSINISAVYWRLYLINKKIQPKLYVQYIFIKYKLK